MANNTNQDISNLVVDGRGVLMTKTKNSLTFKEVTGISPTFDITQEDTFHQFLDLISTKEYDEALMFTFKY